MKALAMLIITVFPAFGADRVLMPQLDGEWWHVAGDPDRGKYSNPKQQPVDFAIWQAADGSWQIWSCIRGTNCGGKTTLFYRWQGSAITDREWQPMGIAMEADPAFGETAGGLQAPHVLKIGAGYYMFYGDWENICKARSMDGKRGSAQETVKAYPFIGFGLERFCPGALGCQRWSSGPHCFRAEGPCLMAAFRILQTTGN